VMQPAMAKIDAPTTHALGNIGAGIIVAVIDSGVDLNHPLLAGALVSEGWDFTRNQAGATDWGDLDQSTAAILDTQDCPWVVDQSTAAILDQSTAAILDQSTAAILDGDCVVAQVNQSTAAILDGETILALEGHAVPAAFGHGTMVAGLVRATAPGARILPVKAFHADGTGRSYDIAQAIYYSVMSGAKVINMSFSFTGQSQEVMWATMWAAQQGAVLVSSAGNRGQVMQVWPAEHKWVISVGSTSLDDVRSPFSNHGYDVFKVGAPGEKLVTLYPGGRYASVAGTSFSTALVSGTLALMSKAVPFLEWGCSDDVMRLGAFAEIADVSRDASNRYPKRLVTPKAVQVVPELDRTRVKKISGY
jgi:subtilisin family serine protease